MALERKKIAQMINVHRVFGNKDVIHFLKNSEKDFVEGLFYYAKRYGRAEFQYKDLKHEILRNKDFSFLIQEAPDDDLSIEEFA